MAIRPEDLHHKACSADDMKISGQIKTVEPMGSDILYEIDTPVGTLHMKDNNHWETLEEAITVYVPRNKILHFDEEGKRVRNK